MRRQGSINRMGKELLHVYKVDDIHLNYQAIAQNEYVIEVLNAMSNPFQVLVEDEDNPWVSKQFDVRIHIREMPIKFSVDFYCYSNKMMLDSNKMILTVHGIKRAIIDGISPFGQYQFRTRYSYGKQIMANSGIMKYTDVV
jgi:hypothetical protein